MSGASRGEPTATFEDDWIHYVDSDDLLTPLPEGELTTAERIRIAAHLRAKGYLTLHEFHELKSFIESGGVWSSAHSPPEVKLRMTSELMELGLVGRFEFESEKEAFFQNYK